MKSSTALNHKKRLLMYTRDIFSRAAAFKLAHAEILEKVTDEILMDAGHKRIPIYMQEFLRGYRECMFDAYYQNLTFVHEFRGTIYHKWDEITAAHPKLDYKAIQDGLVSYHAYKADLSKKF